MSFSMTVTFFLIHFHINFTYLYHVNINPNCVFSSEYTPVLITFSLWTMPKLAIRIISPPIFRIREGNLKIPATATHTDLEVWPFQEFYFIVISETRQQHLIAIAWFERMHACLRGTNTFIIAQAYIRRYIPCIPLKSCTYSVKAIIIIIFHYWWSIWTLLTNVIKAI